MESPASGSESTHILTKLGYPGPGQASRTQNPTGLTLDSSPVPLLAQPANLGPRSPRPPRASCVAQLPQNRDVSGLSELHFGHLMVTADPYAYSGPIRPQGHIMKTQRRFAPTRGLFNPESVAGLTRMRTYLAGVDRD